MTDKTREDVVEAVARAIEPKSWAALGTGDNLAHQNRRTSSLRKATIVLALPALNTRPDVEADMRERCAQVAEQAYDFMQAQGSLSSDSEFVGACEVAMEIATAIRSLPLSNKGESRG